MWSAETGHCSKILADHDDDVKSAAFFTDASMVASSGPSKKDVGPHHWGLRVLRCRFQDIIIIMMIIIIVTTIIIIIAIIVIIVTTIIIIIAIIVIIILIIIAIIVIITIIVIIIIITIIKIIQEITVKNKNPPR